MAHRAMPTLLASWRRYGLPSRNCEYLYQTVCFLIGNSAIKIVYFVGGHFVRNILIFSFYFI